MSDASGEQGVIRFRLGGIEVAIKPSFWMISLLLGWAGRRYELVVVWVAVVFVSVLLHEMGHALAARRFGLRPRIELHTMGGTTHVEGSGALSFAQTLGFVLSGPTIGVCAGLIAMLARHALRDVDVPPIAAAAIDDFVWVNCGYGLLNYLPVLGLAMQAVVEKLRGKKSPAHVAIISLVVIAALGALAFARGYSWAAFMLLWLGASHWKTLSTWMGERADERLDGDFRAAYETVARGELDEALERAASLQRRVRTVAGKARAVLCVADIEMRRGNAERALEALANMPTGWRAPPMLETEIYLANERAEEAVASMQVRLREGNDGTVVRALAIALIGAREYAAAADVAVREVAAIGVQAMQVIDAKLFYAGKYEDAERVAEAAFTAFGHPVDAYNAACSCARARRPDDAIAWLRRAVEAGWDDRAVFETDEDLASLRGHVDFAAVRDSIGPASTT